MIDLTMFSNPVDVEKVIELFPKKIELNFGECLSVENIDVDKYIILYNDRQMMKAISIERNNNKTYTIYITTDLYVGDNTLYLKTIVPDNTIKIFSNYYNN